MYSSKRLIASLASGMAAGGAIALGGWIYAILRTIEPYGALFGALAFSLGIVLVCVCGLGLYTGRIGTLFSLGENDIQGRAIDLAVMFVGNVVAAFAIGAAVKWISPAAASSIEGIVAAKAASGAWEQLFKAVLCGMLVHLGVSLYKKYADRKGLATVLVAACIAAFVLLGLEHCVANAFYLGASIGSWDFFLFVQLVSGCMVGNSLGAWVIEGTKVLLTHFSK